MALYLVQHGIAQPKEVDPEKGLSEEGLLAVKRIAEAAKGHGVSVKIIKHSGKTRARQTAEIFAGALKPSGGVVHAGGLAPLDDVGDVAAELDARADVMLVGHLPFLERLTSYLLTGSVQSPVCKFQNGGIVCLDVEPESGGWFIKWTLLPRIE
jgi:phosphohistidine phosphatase